MAQIDTTLLLERLTEVVAQERRAILAGQLQDMEDLVERKSDLVARIADRNDVDRDAFEILHAQFSRNQQLLESAMSGVRGVADRMKALRSAQETLTVYDGKGRAQRFPTGETPKLMRRA